MKIKSYISSLKKYYSIVLFFAVFLAFGSQTANAQCTPDPYAAQQTWWLPYGLGIYKDVVRIDFQSGSAVLNNPPTGFLGHNMVDGFEGNATVTNPVTGELLFVTNGDQVYRGSDGAQASGPGIGGHRSTEEAAAIIPDPQGVLGRDFIVFGNTAVNYITGVSNGNTGALNAGSYNLETNTVTGVVNLLADNATEGIAEALEVIPHTNGTDYWIVVQGIDQNVKVYAYTAASGFNNTPVSQVFVPAPNPNTLINSFISWIPQQPNKLVITRQQNIGMADFNPTTGAISNYQTKITVSDQYNGYSAALSPNGNYLYFMDFVGGSILHLKYINLTTNSVVTVGQNLGEYFGMKVAPDGRLYVVAWDDLLEKHQLFYMNGTANNPIATPNSTLPKFNTGGRGVALQLPNSAYWACAVTTCQAGDDAPVISATDFDPQPTTAGELVNAITVTNQPANTVISVHTSATPTDGNRLGDADPLIPGTTYYIAFWDEFYECYSPTTETITTCKAGDNAPVISGIDFNPQPTTAGELIDAIMVNNQPAGTVMTVHSATPATDANKLGNASPLSAGNTYYIAFWDETGDCYSPTREITDCPLIDHEPFIYHLFDPDFNDPNSTMQLYKQMFYGELPFICPTAETGCGLNEQDELYAGTNITGSISNLAYGDSKYYVVDDNGDLLMTSNLIEGNFVNIGNAQINSTTVNLAYDDGVFYHWERIGATNQVQLYSSTDPVNLGWTLMGTVSNRPYTFNESGGGPQRTYNMVDMAAHDGVFYFMYYTTNVNIGPNGNPNRTRTFSTTIPLTAASGDWDALGTSRFGFGVTNIAFGGEDVFAACGIEVCPAGGDAPALAQTSFDPTQVATVADLIALLSASNMPAETQFSVHTDSAATFDNRMDPTAQLLPETTYYVAFWNQEYECYSPTTAIETSLAYCVQPGNPSTEGMTPAITGISDRIGFENGWPANIPNAFIAIESANKGFVITRLTTDQIMALDAVEGMLVYDTDENCFKLYNGTIWKCLERSCNE